MTRHLLKDQMAIEFTRLERSFYMAAIRRSKCRPTLAAQMLGVSRAQFFRNVKKLGIKYTKKMVIQLEVKK